MEQAGFSTTQAEITFTLFSSPQLLINLALLNCSFPTWDEILSESLVLPVVSGNKMFSSYLKVINSQVQFNIKTPDFNPT